MMPQTYHRLYTAKAPVNIALIKYWGKSNDALKIPINDSLSGTLDINEMCATTTVAISNSFLNDRFILNGQEQIIDDRSPTKILLNEIRDLSGLENHLTNSCKVHIVSRNNFPTAAGLASSAAGYACLAYVLGHAYGITDPVKLSTIARRGSGSACRSLFGGFVQWIKGGDHETSKACQIAPHEFWPGLRVVICVVNEHQKDVSSSEGMLRSIKTSDLIRHRAEYVVPDRIDRLKESILKKDFETFSKITMQDSNQFHAICLDSYPPIFYMNDVSHQIIRMCTLINSFFGYNKVAYTFDAGPNACIYLLDDSVDLFVNIALKFFMPDMEGKEKIIRGRPLRSVDIKQLQSVCEYLESKGLRPMSSALSHVINTSIGGGPILVEEHLEDEILRP